MRRRTFLTTSAAASIAATARAAARDQVKAGDIPKRVFGKTGEKLTIIGQAGGRFPMITFDEAKAITLRAYELGINYFDCARIYWDGKSEEVYGAVLPPFRKNIFLTTKSPGAQPRKGAEADLEKSLARAQDRLSRPLADPPGQRDERSGADLRSRRRNRGVRSRQERRASAALSASRDTTIREVHLAMLKHYDKYDTILMPLNAADPSYLSFEKMVLPVAVERGMGIQAMKSTANAGLLSRLHVKDCLSYVLSLPVHCVALGCTTIGQIEDDVRIAQQFQSYGCGGDGGVA